MANKRRTRRGISKHDNDNAGVTKGECDPGKSIRFCDLIALTFDSGNLANESFANRSGVDRSTGAGITEPIGV